MEEINIFEMINNFLAITGLISIFIAVIRFIWIFKEDTIWIDDVKIIEYDINQQISIQNESYIQYYPYYPDECTAEFATQNIIMPQNVIIKKAVLKKVFFHESEGADYEYKTIKIFDEISPYTPLCLVIERTNAIPTYMIEWSTEYGAKVQYYFRDNNDGANNMSIFEYRYTFWSKVRKFLDLK